MEDRGSCVDGGQDMRLYLILFYHDVRSTTREKAPNRLATIKDAKNARIDLISNSGNALMLCKHERPSVANSKSRTNSIHAANNAQITRALRVMEKKRSLAIQE